MLFFYVASVIKHNTRPSDCRGVLQGIAGLTERVSTSDVMREIKGRFVENAADAARSNLACAIMVIFLYWDWRPAGDDRVGLFAVFTPSHFSGLVQISVGNTAI
jgi:hypothetical protein